MPIGYYISIQQLKIDPVWTRSAAIPVSSNFSPAKS
jgi:hypothetical protein